jgi:uncharacterized protein
MDAPMLAELAWATARAGHASLRFQHRGRGASQGSPDPARALDDARAALAHLAESAGPVVAAVGLRGGCATALALAGVARLRRVVLVAPERPLPAPPGVKVLALLPEVGAPVTREAVAAALGAGDAAEIVLGADWAFRAGIAVTARRAVGWLTAR